MHCILNFKFDFTFIVNKYKQSDILTEPFYLLKENLLLECIKQN